MGKRTLLARFKLWLEVRKEEKLARRLKKMDRLLENYWKLLRQQVFVHPGQLEKLACLRTERDELAKEVNDIRMESVKRGFDHE